MFFRMLNDDQKRTLLVLANHLVVTDHVVSGQEDNLITEVVHGLRTDQPVDPNELLGKPNTGVFDTDNTQRAAMLTLMTLAYGDDAFQEGEVKMLRELSDEFGFSADDFETLRAWGEKAAVLLGEAYDMMG